MSAVRLLFDRAMGVNRGIALAVWFHLGLLVMALVALPFDHRHILGLNPWIKPMKFDVSTLIYAVTIGLFLSLLEGSARARWTIGWGIGVAMIVENTIISLQSARGLPSHMNYTSWLNGVSFGIMGVFIVFNTVLVAWLLLLYATDRVSVPTAVTWGIRLGLLALLAGSVEGVMMVGRYGAHTVGAADGGAGLPFVNWSTGHGDLRVAHFFALHALQLFPLLGWALSRTSLPVRAQCLATVAGAALYLAGVWALFAQAVAGRPVLPVTTISARSAADRSGS